MLISVPPRLLTLPISSLGGRLFVQSTNVSFSFCQRFWEAEPTSSTWKSTRTTFTRSKSLELEGHSCRSHPPVSPTLQLIAIYDSPHPPSLYKSSLLHLCVCDRLARCPPLSLRPNYNTKELHCFIIGILTCTGLRRHRIFGVCSSIQEEI